MLTVSNLNLHLGERQLFKNLSFGLSKSEKVALAGINGSGKTTLLNLIASGESKAISLAGETEIGYLPQHLNWKSELSVIDEVMKQQKSFQSLEKEMEEQMEVLNTSTDYESDAYLYAVQRVAELSERIGYLDPHEQRASAEKILKGLGFEQEDFDRSSSEFSGGWKMRISLAQILLNNPTLLLLDEPTNHLDLNSIIWLESYLKSFDGGIILISHDRRFLDAITTRTIELVRGEAHDYPFSYSKYLVERGNRIAIQLKTQRNQLKEVERTEVLINKFKAKASKASMAKSLSKRLERMEVIEVDDFSQKSLQAQFMYSQNPGKSIIAVKEIHKVFGDKVVLEDIGFEIERGDKVALVGKNGVGKSTLLKIINEVIQEDEGLYEWGHNIEKEYFRQNGPDTLPGKQTILEWMEEHATPDTYTNCRNILGGFLFSGESVDKKISVLSGGEKTRLVLANMANHPSNVLILDEPTNHLDIPSKENLKQALQKYPGTVIVVSHDREFLSGWCEKVVELEKGKSKVFPGTIDDFLEEKMSENLVDYALSGKKPKEESKAEKTKTDTREESKEKKRRENKIKNLENRIEKLEAELNELEGKLQEKMEAPKMNELLKVYESKKVDLDKYMTEWENIQE